MYPLIKNAPPINAKSAEGEALAVPVCPTCGHSRRTEVALDVIDRDLDESRFRLRRGLTDVIYFDIVSTDQIERTPLEGERAMGVLLERVWSAQSPSVP